MKTCSTSKPSKKKEPMSVADIIAVAVIPEQKKKKPQPPNKGK